MEEKRCERCVNCAKQSDTHFVCADLHNENDNYGYLVNLDYCCEYFSED